MKARLLLISCLWLFCLLAEAQIIDLKQWEEYSARSIGPAGMSGRVTCVAIHPDRKKNIYVGTASGGVWLSQDAGHSWEPIFDDQPILAIGAIAIHPLNPDLIWVGTGEGNPRNSHNSGAGVFKSMDGGESWEYMGLKETKLIHRLILDPHDMHTAYVAALGSAWGPSPDRGVYKTTDGGYSWDKILYVNDETGVGDMVQDPDNPMKLIAATWEFGRKPWTFNSGGEGSGLHITYDGGANWTKLSSDDGLPKGKLGRIGLAISHSSPERVYALVEAKKNDLYRSDDGGKSWRKMNAKGNAGNRPFYYGDIYVDPSNENRIYSIHSTITRSEDGGRSFQSFVPWQEVHPDHHALWIDPEDPDYMINGNDGGLAISYDRGENWRFVENLPVGQFYHVNHDMDVPYNVYGGMQDNGSWIGPSAVWKRGGMRNADWRELYFGDGFDVVPRPDNNRYGYAMSQGGNVAYYDRLTGNNRFVKPLHPDGETLRFNWNAAIAQDPYNDCGVYYGSQYVHYSNDCGKSWRIISPDLTSNDSTKQKQATSGGLTIDATQAENHTTILSIAPSPVDSDVIWVGTDDGRLHMTRDGGDTWTRVDIRLPGCPAGAWFPHIELSKTDASELIVTVNNYRRNDWSAYAYHTKDGGTTWKRIADDRQIGGHVMCVVQDAQEPDLLFLGSDVGLYFTVNGGQKWQKFTNGMPPASVRDLKIHQREDDLIIGTFGRAIYILDNIKPLRALAQDASAFAQMKAFNAQDAYLTGMRSVDGTRFIASTYFVGENKSPAARLPIWLPSKDKVDKAETVQEAPQKKKKKGKKDMSKEDSSKVEDHKDSTEKTDPRLYILDASGDTLRTLHPELEEGMNFVYWWMDRDGVRMPSRSEPKEDAAPPGGVSVSPGVYRYVITDGVSSSSATVEVKMSPHADITLAEYEAAVAHEQSVEDMMSQAYEARERLREMKKHADMISSMNEAFDEELQDSLSAETKDIKKSLSRLLELFFPPADFKGIDSVTKRLPTYLWTARRYASLNEQATLNGNAQIAMEDAQRELAKVLAEIEKFETEEWSGYRQFVESSTLQIFKD